MKKRILVNRANFQKVVNQAVEILKRGGVVAYPTETLYGLAGAVSKGEAVLRVRKIKGKTEPILILVSGEKMAENYVEIDDRARRLIQRFWPGPLTLVLKPKPDACPTLELLRAQAKGLALRRSSDKFAQALVENLGEPITSTSANRSRQEPLTYAEEIEKELGRELDLIVDDGPRTKTASTIIDLTGPEPEIIREGLIKLDEIKTVLK